MALEAALVSRAAGIQVPEQHLPAECRGHGRGPTRDQSLAKQAGPAALPTRVGSRGLGPREAFLLWPCFSAVAHKTQACAATGLCWAVPPSRLQEPSSASFSSPAAGPDRDRTVLTPQAQLLPRSPKTDSLGVVCGDTLRPHVFPRGLHCQGGHAGPGAAATGAGTAGGWGLGTPLAVPAPALWACPGPGGPVPSMREGLRHLPVWHLSCAADRQAWR